MERRRDGRTRRLGRADCGLMTVDCGLGWIPKSKIEKLKIFYLSDDEKIFTAD
jgi:hypothetical protein